MERVTIFVAIAHAGWAGTPRYEKPDLWLGTANWTADSATPHPDPSGGQAPAYIFSFRLCHSRFPRENDDIFRRFGDSTGATYFRTNDGG